MPAKKFEDTTFDMKSADIINVDDKILLKQSGGTLYQRTFPEGIPGRWVSRRVKEFEEYVAKQEAAKPKPAKKRVTKKKAA